MSTLIQFRRDTAANWASVNPVLAQGELGLVTDTGLYKIGNGVDAWNTLAAGQMTGSVTALTMTSTTDPGAAAAGTMTLYVKSVAGRQMPKFVGPAGLDSALQPMLARNKIGYWCPPGNSTTVPGVLGYIAPTIVGTVTARNVTTASLFTRMRRLGIVSVATAAGLASARAPSAQVTTGGTDGSGFFKTVRFGISDAALVATARMFVGVSSSVSAPTNVEPSTLANCIGVGHRAADTTMHIFYGGSTAQAPINLGANFPANTTNTDAYDLTLFAPPNSADVYYEVTRLNTGHVATGLLASAGGVALPANTTLLSYMWAYRTNNATAAAVGLDLMSDYIETDY